MSKKPIINFDNLRLNLEDVEAISDIISSTCKIGVFWSEIYKQWHYTVHMKSGKEFTTYCFEESEYENFKSYYNNIVDEWEGSV